MRFARLSACLHAVIHLVGGRISTQEDLQKLLDDRVALGWNPAIVAALITPEGTLQAVSGGKDEDLTVDTLFEIGSITKLVTGVLFQDSIAKNEVSEGDLLIDHLPHMNHIEHADKITLRHLATHQSGIPYLPDYEWRHDDKGSLEDVSDAYLANLKQLNFQPGTDNEYSNVATGVLGLVLVHKNKDGLRSFEELVQQRFARPLGLDPTSFSTMQPSSPAQIARLAQRHDDVGPLTEPILESVRYYKLWAAAGSIVASLEQMTVFAKACLREPGSTLAEAVRESQTPREKVGLVDIGLFWHSKETPSGGRLYSHAGLTSGFRSWLGCDPETGRAAVVLTNNSAVPADVEDLGAHLVDSTLPLPRLSAKETIMVDQATVESVLGNYQSGGVVLNVARSATLPNVLDVSTQHGPAFELYKESAHQEIWLVRGRNRLWGVLFVSAPRGGDIVTVGLRIFPGPQDFQRSPPDSADCGGQCPSKTKKERSLTVLFVILGVVGALVVGGAAFYFYKKRQ